MAKQELWEDDENGPSEAKQPFTINEDYAKRHEHNKRREELHRLDEKYRKSTNGTHDEPGSDDSSSSDEDEDGVLTSTLLDAQITDTLRAIKTKDPRIFDKDAKFYSDIADTVEQAQPKDAKPIYLNDYHRMNLLDNTNAAMDTAADPVHETYGEQQDNLKQQLLEEVGAPDEDGDEFFVAKNIEEPAGRDQRHAAPTIDPDQNPEAFLSDFISSRAWVPNESSRFQAFDSDDDEDDDRADRFEEAYNMRFEDPAQANEKLMSHARDAAAKYSVRKTPVNPRRRAREIEREKKAEEKRVRREEKARLKQLKIADAEEKIRQIRQSAGVAPQSEPSDEWRKFLRAAWDDESYAREMGKHFGPQYYEQDDVREDGNVAGKAKKPKWKDDIEINDLVSDFDPTTINPDLLPDLTTTDTDVIPDFESTNHDPGGDSDVAENDPNAESLAMPERTEKQKARAERQEIERIVEQDMREDEQLASWGTKHKGLFRYRETSPQAFGMTASDILMASDSQLNQFVGLKKMAAFREVDKKRRDRRRLGKKARLRQWRQETFGADVAPNDFRHYVAGQDQPKKRSRKKR